MNLFNLKIKLNPFLNGNLPGTPAQLKMLVRTWQKKYKMDDRSKGINSAVLILIYPKNDQLYFFLTQRSQTVKHHKGQISLPGGASEKNETFQETALRETEEEIGVDASKIEIIGKLSTLVINVTGFIIHPFIGIVHHEPKTELAHLEVETLFSVTLDDLVNQTNIHMEKRLIFENYVEVPYFKFGEKKVWGATAMILSEFREVLLKIQ